MGATLSRMRWLPLLLVLGLAACGGLATTGNGGSSGSRGTSGAGGVSGAGGASGAGGGFGTGGSAGAGGNSGGSSGVGDSSGAGGTSGSASDGGLPEVGSSVCSPPVDDPTCVLCNDGMWHCGIGGLPRTSGYAQCPSADLCGSLSACVNCGLDSGTGKNSLLLCPGIGTGHTAFRVTCVP